MHKAPKLSNEKRTGDFSERLCNHEMHNKNNQQLFIQTNCDVKLH